MASVYVLLLIGVLLLGLGLPDVSAEKALVRVKRTKGHINVTAILEDPFLMEVKGEVTKLKGNERYEGYIKDILDEICASTGFTYKINVTPGNSYDGMVKDLINKRADMAAGALTITTRRLVQIDMSSPFMASGITILMNKKDAIVEVAPPIDTSIVVRPFKAGVWICVILGAILVTGCFYIINRFNPYEKDEEMPEKKKENEGEKELSFGFVACIWMVVGGLTLQGYTKRPQSTAALVLFFVWWAFSLVVFAFYVSGIMRSGIYEAVPDKVAKIKGFADLVEQQKVKYGALKEGSTAHFFKLSKLVMYYRAGMFMQSYPKRMVSTLGEGLERVRQGKYALLAETPFVEYVSGKKPCNVMQVGGQLNSVGYGFGLQKNSRFKDKINSAILMLQEQQAFQILKKKWWHSLCELEEDPRSRVNVTVTPPAQPLAMDSIGGIFIIFFVGVLVAMVTMAGEIFWHRENQPKKPESTAKEEQPLQEVALT